MMEPPHELGYCAQRFPLRARHNRGLGSGHWLAARFPRGPPAGHHEPPEGHREPPEGHRLLGWPCLGPPSGWGCPPRGSQPAGPGPSRPGVPVDERRRVLDRGLLLRLHGVETPPDLCTVDVTDQHLDQGPGLPFRHCRSWRCPSTLSVAFVSLLTTSLTCRCWTSPTTRWTSATSWRWQRCLSCVCSICPAMAWRPSLQTWACAQRPGRGSWLWRSCSWTGIG
ncbi:uncharacterized protein LOC142907955 isoform X3 [Petromyzon marinus]|uniref:uncharacterized protein LOC142907955 isoform X3 n=1 Tax=Petromyzon marinus TaxID=7757 RepID=UPI003F6EB15F